MSEPARDDHPHITLGTRRPHQLPAYPQSFARIVKRLGRAADALTGAVDSSGEFDSAAFVGRLGDRVYEVLETFVPNISERVPQWELAGYASADAAEHGDYDEQLDNAPTFPQMIEALDVIVEVNGGKRFLKMLESVFDPKMLRAELTLTVADELEAMRARRNGSRSSPSTRDGSDGQKSSGPTIPTEDRLDTAELVQASV